MTVDEAMAMDKGGWPQTGMVGEAWPEWCDIGVVEVRSGVLTANEFGVMSPDEGASVEVAPGSYRVQAKIISFDGNLGVCRARVLPDPPADVNAGRHLGNVGIDLAKIAVGDIADAARGLTDDDLLALAREVRVADHTMGNVVTLSLPSKTISLACIATGFGDGSYPATSLVRDDETVGLEIEFIEDGYVVPESAHGSP